MIDSLPNEDSSQELQIQSLKTLEQQNQEAAERLEEVRWWKTDNDLSNISPKKNIQFQVIRKGESLLEKIQTALGDIAQAQLDMQVSNTKK